MSKDEREVRLGKHMMVERASKGCNRSKKEVFKF